MIRTLRHAQDNGFRAGILSNNAVEREPYSLPIHAPAREEDCPIDSYKAGARKPNPKIINLATKTTDADTDDHADGCILIDDHAKNYEATRTQGRQTVDFRDNTQTLHDLSRITGLPSIV